jgi:DNA-nicking Smr family endonuclease
LRVRSLSPEEAALWAKVAETIRPLSRKAVASSPAPDLSPPPPTAVTKVRGRVPLARPIAPAPPLRPTIESNLDGTWDRRLASGSVRPDRTLDLHGMNLNHAWAAIDRSIEAALASGDRIILLITGHNRPLSATSQRGKIRAAVHDWLAASRHARDIAAVRGAHPRHGGGGSLYIILRKGRTSTVS